MSTDNLNDFSKVRLIQPGDPVAAAVPNQPIEALMAQIAALQQQVNQLTNTNQTQIIIPNVPVYSESSDPTNSVGLYDVVYFNASSGLYEKAEATVTSVNGAFISNPTALGFGVVVSISGSIASVMVGGFSSWNGTSQQTAMLEAGQVFNAGLPYFLSATHPGKITQYPPALRIQILIATASHFVMDVAFSTPESSETVYNTSIGMRPVGDIRTMGPGYTDNVVVGFDALELYDTGNNLWRLSSNTDVSSILQSYGYIVADATVTKAPSKPIYIRIEVSASTGNIKIFSANSIEELYDGSPTIFNVITGLTGLSSGSKYAVRNYNVSDASSNTYGTLSFNFTDSDVTYLRARVFQFPDAFQGWKMVNAPIPPTATATVVGGAVASVTMVECGIGYVTAPSVSFTGGGGTGAAATAILDDFGAIAKVLVTAGGTGYTTAPAVVFSEVITGASVTNGGSGATATATVSGGAITAATVTAAGSGYNAAPNVVVTDSAGTGYGAVVNAIVINGSIARLNVISGGTAYTSPVLTILPPGNSGYQTNGSSTPYVSISGGGGTGATASLALAGSMGIDHVDVICPGGSYLSTTTLGLSGGGGTGAAIQPVIVNGQIVSVTVVSPGTGYSSAPTVTVGGTTGANANNAQFLAVLGASVTSVSLTAAGTGYTSLPTVGIATPIKAVTVQNPGAGYGSAPTVAISAPDAAGGVQATATAYLGAAVTGVTVASGGTLYANTDTISVGAPGGGGIQAVIVPIFNAGILVSAVITNPGSGYVSAPALSVTTSTGSGATLTATISGSGTVVAIIMNNSGQGYVNPATVTFSGGSPTTPATALAQPLGSGANAQTAITGNVGLQCTGSKLQVATFHQDLDSNGIPFPKPQSCVFYYNIKADPNLSARYPAIPLTKLLFLMNGVELTASAYDPINQVITDAYADVGIATPTILWPNFDQNGSPWDQSYQSLVADVVIGGVDAVIPNTGPGGVISSVAILTGGTGYNSAPSVSFSGGGGTGAAGTAVVSGGSVIAVVITNSGSGYTSTPSVVFGSVAGASGASAVAAVSAWWQYWEHVNQYQQYRNRACMWINRASQLFQSGKVLSLGALSPLQLIDVASGVDVSNDGTPMTGQLLLTINNQVNLLGGTLNQIDLTQVNSVIPIYQNTTGRSVIVYSIIINVVNQQNQSGLTPTVANCAQVTVGTQSGNYVDYIGSSTADVAPTRLFAVNQFKELFPDSDSAAPLLQPGELLYLQVVNPAGGPITSQVVVVRIKGTVL